jgi:hypothetical protein
MADEQFAVEALRTPSRDHALGGRVLASAATIAETTPLLSGFLRVNRAKFEPTVFLLGIRVRVLFHVIAASLITLIFAVRISAEPITFQFSGAMQGNAIYADGTRFFGSFTYQHPQSYDAGGRYLLESYSLTVLGSTLLPVLPGEGWNGGPVNNGRKSIVVSDTSTDFFRASIDRIYSLIYSPGMIRLSGPEFTFSDSTGSVFQGTSLPDLSLVGDRFDGGQILIGFSIDGGSSAMQTGTITSVPEPSTYAMALAGLACGGYSLFRRRGVR